MKGASVLAFLFVKPESFLSLKERLLIKTGGFFGVFFAVFQKGNNTKH